MDAEIAEERARRELDAGGDGAEAGEWRPSLRDWNLSNALAAQQVDLLQQLIAVNVAVGGAKPPKLKNFPRPESATEQAKKRLLLERGREMAALFGF